MNFMSSTVEEENEFLQKVEEFWRGKETAGFSARNTVGQPVKWCSSDAVQFCFVGAVSYVGESYHLDIGASAFKKFDSFVLSRTGEITIELNDSYQFDRIHSLLIEFISQNRTESSL